MKKSISHSSMAGAFLFITVKRLLSLIISNRINEWFMDEGENYMKLRKWGSDPGGELNECGEWVARNAARATIEV